MLEAGVPEPRTLIHLDGQDHKDHRQVTNDWFKPAAVKTRQSRIDGLADLFVEKMRAWVASATSPATSPSRTPSG